jgi:exopolysaccharide biosynthesis polyprenyl glycosylphosphotransferase
MMQKRLDTIKYIAFDWLSAAVAWFAFFYYRKFYIASAFFGTDNYFDFDKNLVAGLLILPTAWVFLYALMGTYGDVYRKSRLNELGRTLLASSIGVTLLFFIIILDDIIFSIRGYYQSFATLFLLHFLLTFIIRFVQLTSISRRFNAGKITFTTIMVGGNQSALELYQEIQSRTKPLGNAFVGFVSLYAKEKNPLSEHLPRLGDVEELPELIRAYKAEEVIIALDDHQHKKFSKVVNMVKDEGVIIKIIPDMYDIMLGHVKMQQIFGAILIEIYPAIMPAWQRTLKRVIDVGASFLALIVLSPLLTYIALRVKFSSPGPILYSQERIGHKGQPFTIYKFRSMVVDAESAGPALSSDHDPRVTRWGAFMRKMRLDELPQFYNVLIGEMSLVGPRPERKFYIDQIMKVAPHYKHLLKVKPGITSWGQVKYGYAENIDQMVERLKFDILYIENMSLLVDFKILIYTVLTILEARGK